MSGESHFKETEIGLIPEDWEITTFDKVISHIVDNRGRSAPTSEKGIALIATNCIKETGLFPTKEKIRYVSEETYNNWFRDHPKPDDIIIVNKGTPGMVCLVPEYVDFCIAQDMVAVRPNRDKIYGRFLFAFMRSRIFKHEVDSLNVGTTIPHLKKTYFPLLKVPLPSHTEQEEIGELYYNLSLKIELNQQMNETLEQIGEAIFKHWFVDFEFQNERGKPYRSSGGEMVDSELGEIPRGWEIRSLDQIADFLNGLALQNYPPTDSNYLPVIKIKELRQGISETSDHASPNIPNEYKIVDGDVLFSWSGSLEVIVWCGGRGALNQHLFKVTSPKYPKWFYYSWIKYHLPEFRRIAAGKATTMGHIQRHHLSEAMVIVPKKEELNKMSRIMDPLLDLYIANEVESRTLRNIRDSLLPKLMSGEIRIKAPECENS